MKKYITGLVVAFMLLNLSVMAVSFIDVDETTKMGQAIENLAEKGVVNGVGNGYFRPDDTLTRSQFVKIVNKVFGYTHKGENKFTDVTADKWYYDDVLIAVEAGYINGVGDGRFAPEDRVTREMACVMVNNILKMELIPYFEKPIDSISPWAEKDVLIVLSNGLISSEDGNVLRAIENMTRGEACLMLEKCLLDDVGPIESIDLKSIAKEELEIRMNRVILAMESKVIPELDDEKSIIVSRCVIDNMESYLMDNSHDYIQAAKDTFQIYRTIPKEKRERLKGKIQDYNNIEDLLLLYEFFYIVEK